MKRLVEKIRAVPDFPRPGLLFRDITPLVRDPETLRLAVHQLMHPFIGERVDAVASLEARGFIFGSLVAWELGVGFIPLRKPGKLPYDVQRASYIMDDSAVSLEVHNDAVTPGDRVLLVDELLATGAEAAASCQLLEDLGAQITACAFLVELLSEQGRSQLAKYRVYSLIHY